MDSVKKKEKTFSITLSSTTFLIVPHCSLGFSKMLSFLHLLPGSHCKRLQCSPYPLGSDLRLKLAFLRLTGTSSASSVCLSRWSSFRQYPKSFSSRLDPSQHTVEVLLGIHGVPLGLPHSNVSLSGQTGRIYCKVTLCICPSRGVTNHHFLPSLRSLAFLEDDDLGSLALLVLLAVLAFILSYPTPPPGSPQSWLTAENHSWYV